jgi:hypothetical protein
MDKIIISGIPPYDGEYPFEGGFNYGELRTIKRIAGVRAGELYDALEGGDSDVVVAAAIIALERAGKTVDEQDFWKADSGAIRLESTPSAVPTTPPAGGEPNESSGNDTTTFSASPGTDPSRTGSPLSDTGAASDPVTSAA